MTRGEVHVDHVRRHVLASDMADDQIRVSVRNGKELYFQVLDSSGGKSTTVVLDPEQTQKLLLGVLALLHEQAEVEV